MSAENFNDIDEFGKKSNPNLGPTFFFKLQSILLCFNHSLYFKKKKFNHSARFEKKKNEYGEKI